MKSRTRSIVAVATALTLGFGLASAGSAVGPASSAYAAPGDSLLCKFSSAQVFDVQWNIAGSTLNVSNLREPFGAGVSTNYPGNAPSVNQIDASDLLATDYFQFFDSTTVVGTLGFMQFDSTGTPKGVNGVIDATGTFAAIGTDFIFYNGGGIWGTLITTGAGFNYGDTAALTITNAAPTTADVRDATGLCSATPFAAPAPPAAPAAAAPTLPETGATVSEPVIGVGLLFLLGGLSLVFFVARQKRIRAQK